MTSQHEVVAVTQALIRINTTNGNETIAARYLADYLRDGGIDANLIAKDPARSNLVARIPGTDPAAPSLAFVGHLDVVPADPRDWTHPPFAAEIDDQGFMFGRGAVDMKGEVAARAVAMKALAASGFRPRGDLWLLAVADEENGSADVGMRWLLAEHPEIRPDFAVNEGGGARLGLADGRTMVEVSVGDKGTQPVRVVTTGEAGHASMPTVGDNAVPHIGEVLRRIGRGLPNGGSSRYLDQALATLTGRQGGYFPHQFAEACRLHPVLAHLLPTFAGTTMAPTRLGGAKARNVMPARAWVELDCRILPGVTRDQVEMAVIERLGDGLDYELEWSGKLVPGSASVADGPLYEAISEFVGKTDPGAEVLPMLCAGYTDSSLLRLQTGAAAYGFNPYFTTPPEVLVAGYHNADERVHVEDLELSVRFHVDLAERLLDSKSSRHLSDDTP
ncbi:MAG: M20/M25/M40 family metallo-hydrolase [Nocardioides sp.]